MNPIVLASGSPRRRQLLEMLRIPFRVIPPDVDEHVLAGEQADAYVTRLARAKAQAVVARAPGEVILAADTTVALRGKIFEKPTSPQNAVEMLEQLQGQTHKVLTAVSVAALTIYDMVKAVDKEMIIGEIRLMEKSGGRSGQWKRGKMEKSTSST